MVRVFNCSSPAYSSPWVTSCSGKYVGTTPSPHPDTGSGRAEIDRAGARHPPMRSSSPRCGQRSPFKNGTSDQAGTRTYEFQIPTAPISQSQRVVRRLATRSSRARPASPKAPAGRPAMPWKRELQPTTRLYWRARVVQGSTASEWSAGAELQDQARRLQPAGRAIRPADLRRNRRHAGRLDDVRGRQGHPHQRPEFVRPVSARADDPQWGVFGRKSKGLYPNGPGAKLKVMSMMDGTGNLFTSKYLLNMRCTAGVDGNPDNCHRLQGAVRR